MALDDRWGRDVSFGERIAMEASIRAEADAGGADLPAHPTAFDDGDPVDWFSASNEPGKDRTAGGRD